MKRIFLDTNFIIDYLLRDDYKPTCVELLANGIQNGKIFYISFLSVANFAYVARKLPADKLYHHLNTISELFNVVDNNTKQLSKAISLMAPDFEDALQYECAKYAHCDCIITRNQKDFGFSDIPVLSAQEYLLGKR